MQRIELFPSFTTNQSMFSNLEVRHAIISNIAVSYKGSSQVSKKILEISSLEDCL